ncbi:MAG: hypothetical protein IKO93_12695 [Lentisphaeria bacterium]|nr:hypothetical protein [Lentisphaeria bacterium]
MNIKFFNCSVFLAILLSFGLLTASAQQSRKPTAKSAEQESILRQINELEKAIQRLRKESEFLKKNDRELKSFADVIREGSGSKASIEERQNAAKAIVLLQKIVGKLDAKFDKAGYLLNADQVCIQYLQKLKARRIYLLEQEMKLMDQQNELLKKVKKQTKD